VRKKKQKRAESEKITQALRAETALNNTKHIVFSDNDDTKQDTIKLFDSDESDKDESVKEYKSMDIVINPLFEGASGRDRLNLQKKFRGDERFKLTEDFVSDDDEDNPKDMINESPFGKTDDEEITKLLKEERENQFDILKVMFGDDMKSERSNLKKKKKLNGKIWFILILTHQKQNHWKFKRKKLMNSLRHYHNLCPKCQRM